jgi:stage II sporulation protein M
LTTQQPRQRGLTNTLLGRYTEYARSLVPILLLCSLLFVFSLTMGFVLGKTMNGAVLQDILETFPDPSNSPIEDFGFILANNTLKSLFFMVGGIFGGILPLFLIIFNGFFIGWTSYYASSIFGIGFIIAGLTPHGIIEIPAILLAMSMGVSLGYTVLNRLKGKGSLWIETWTALGFFITRVFPLLLLAAGIEVFITKPLLIILFS